MRPSPIRRRSRTRLKPRLASTAILLILVTLGSLAATPDASAHVTNFGDTRSLQLGDAYVVVTPKTSALYANTPTDLTIQIVDPNAGFTNPDIQLTVTAPDGTRTRLPLTPTGPGEAASRMTLTTRGNHTLTARLATPTGNREANATWEVYPDLPVRIVPVDDSLDITSGQLTQFAIQTLGPDEFTPRAIDDLEARIELWSDDHSRVLDAREIPFELHRGTSSLWEVKFDFPKPGMYHVRFQSRDANFTYADAPLLHTYAVAPKGGPTRETPSIQGALLLGLILAVALARRTTITRNESRDHGG